MDWYLRRFAVYIKASPHEMRFFISGELDSEIGESFRPTRLKVEGLLNSTLADRSYGSGLEKIAIIPMILGPRFAEGRKERRYVNRREKWADYRLSIDFEAFKTGTEAQREDLLVQNILASVADIHRKLKGGFDGDNLRRDIEAMFNRQQAGS